MFVRESGAPSWPRGTILGTAKSVIIALTRVRVNADTRGLFEDIRWRDACDVPSFRFS